MRPPAEAIGAPARPLRRWALEFAEQALCWSGAAWAYAAVRRPSLWTVVNYHSVPDRDAEGWIDPSNATAPGLFEAQMRFLARRRRVIPMSDLVEGLQQGRRPEPRSVVLTFDDGYRDFLTVSAPILERFRLPAMVFLCTGYARRGEMHWIDRLYTAFQRRTRTPEGAGGGVRVGGETYQQIVARLVRTSPDEREQVLREVEAVLVPEAKPPRLTLTWDEARLLRDRYPLLEFGSHTVEHANLAQCSSDAADREVRESAEELERELGVRPRYFSFPYGRWSPSSRGAVIAAGYGAAAASREDPVVRPGSDAFTMPRLGPPDSVTMLSFLTGGAYPDLPRRFFFGRA